LASGRFSDTLGAAIARDTVWRTIMALRRAFLILALGMALFAPIAARADDGNT
jgi:hypothetical protein